MAFYHCIPLMWLGKAGRYLKLCKMHWLDQFIFKVQEENFGLLPSEVIIQVTELSHLDAWGVSCIEIQKFTQFTTGEQIGKRYWGSIRQFTVQCTLL